MHKYKNMYLFISLVLNRARLQKYYTTYWQKQNLCFYFHYHTTVRYVPYGSMVMEVLFSVKIFDVEFSPVLYVLRSPESKKVVFGNWSVRMYVCVCVCVCVCV